MVVRELPFRDVYIMPGSRLKLRQDIQRSLPSGNYTVSGALFVDGRRVKPIDIEVSFVGDKTTSKVAADVVIGVSPSVIPIETAPGSMRSATVEVRNDSSDQVSIRAHMLTPKVLGGLVSPTGERGESMSCAEWVEVSPSEFILGGNRTQNIRVITRMPEGMGARGYYGDLSLYASYADGTNAGMTSAQVCVVNGAVQPNPFVRDLVFKYELSQASKYLVSVRFRNVGDVHVSSKCKAQLVQTDGTVLKWASMPCEGKTGLMLPLESRDFTGELDLKYINPGFYRLEAVLDYYTPVDAASSDKKSSEANKKSSEANKTSSAVKPADEKSKVLTAKVGKAVQIRLDDKNQRVVDTIADATFLQEASKVRGTIKW